MKQRRLECLGADERFHGRNLHSISAKCVKRSITTVAESTSETQACNYRANHTERSGAFCRLPLFALRNAHTFALFNVENRKGADERNADLFGVTCSVALLSLDELEEVDVRGLLAL